MYAPEVICYVFRLRSLFVMLSYRCRMCFPRWPMRSQYFMVRTSVWSCRCVWKPNNNRCPLSVIELRVIIISAVMSQNTKEFHGKGSTFCVGIWVQQKCRRVGCCLKSQDLQQGVVQLETTHVHSVVHVLHVLHVLTLLSPCIGAVCDNNTNNASVNLGYDRS